jgi:hypothetical protein
LRQRESGPEATQSFVDSFWTGLPGGPSAGRRSYLKKSPGGGGLIGSQGSPRCQGPSSSGFFGSRRGSSHLATCLTLCATRLVNVGRFRSRYRIERVYAASPIESPAKPSFVSQASRMDVPACNIARFRRNPPADRCVPQIVGREGFDPIWVQLGPVSRVLRSRAAFLCESGFPLAVTDGNAAA